MASNVDGEEGGQFRVIVYMVLPWKDSDNKEQGGTMAGCDKWISSLQIPHLSALHGMRAIHQQRRGLDLAAKRTMHTSAIKSIQGMFYIAQSLACLC